MRILEILKSTVGCHTLSESDKFVMEMANFLADVTDLPANIVLWSKTQPEELPHTKYRMKIFKDRIHVATCSIGATPVFLWEVSRNKFKLTKDEKAEVVRVVSDFSTLFIQYVDGKMTDSTLKLEIKKIRGQKYEFN